MTSEGGSSLGGYLQDIARDPALAKRFRENPERAMAEAGLTEEQRDLILSGSAQAVRNAIAEDLDRDVHVELLAFHWPVTWPIVWP